MHVKNTQKIFSTQPFPVVKVQKFFEFVFPIPENPREQKISRFGELFKNSNFSPRAKKFVSDFDDFGVIRLLSSSPKTFAIDRGFKLNVPEIVWTHGPTKLHVYSRKNLDSCSNFLISGTILRDDVYVSTSN
jgi:hypothetical protein